MQLDENYACRLWGDPARPPVCGRFPADAEHCGNDRQQALAILERWEQLTG